MIHRKIAAGYKECSHKLCAHPWKPLKKFGKDKSQPDNLCRFCKDCQKAARDRHKKKYANSQAQNKEVYKKVWLKPTYIHHKCLGYTPDGAPCPNKPKIGYYCPECEKKRAYILEKHEMIEEYEMEE